MTRSTSEAIRSSTREKPCSVFVDIGPFLSKLLRLEGRGNRNGKRAVTGSKTLVAGHPDGDLLISRWASNRQICYLPLPGKRDLGGGCRPGSKLVQGIGIVCDRSSRRKVSARGETCACGHGEWPHTHVGSRVGKSQAGQLLHLVMGKSRRFRSIPAL